MAGISSRALAFGEPINNFKTFQGQKIDVELGLNWMQYKWRNHDPQIGRFIEVDPLADKFRYNGTYVFSENKVINGVELEGLEVLTLSGTVDGMLGFMGGDYNLGVAIGPDGVAGLGSAGFRVGIGAEFGVGGTLSYFPTMKSTSELEGTGYSLSVSGGGLGVFGIGVVESSGHYGIAVSAELGMGFQASFGVNNTNVTKSSTIPWKEVAQQLGFNNPSAAFDHFKNIAVNQLDDAVVNRKTSIAAIKKEIESEKSEINKILKSGDLKEKSTLNKIDQLSEKINNNGQLIDMFIQDIKKIEGLKNEIKNMNTQNK